MPRRLSDLKTHYQTGIILIFYYHNIAMPVAGSIRKLLKRSLWYDENFSYIKLGENLGHGYREMVLYVLFF